MAVTNWENLAKNGMNPQTIPAFVDEKIGEHNANATAHLASEASLAAHRASEVCDHLAESVVNDKLAVTARRYQAIVDPTSPTDFATVQGALDYCRDNGGGDILVTRGEHYLAESVYIPPTVSLYGYGAGESTILSNSGTTRTIYYYDTIDLKGYGGEVDTPDNGKNNYLLYSGITNYEAPKAGQILRIGGASPEFYTISSYNVGTGRVYLTSNIGGLASYAEAELMPTIKLVNSSDRAEILQSGAETIERYYSGMSLVDAQTGARYETIGLEDNDTFILKKAYTGTTKNIAVEVTDPREATINVEGITLGFLTNPVSFYSFTRKATARVRDCKNVLLPVAYTSSRYSSYDGCVFDCKTIASGGQFIQISNGQSFNNCVFIANGASVRGVQIMGDSRLVACRFLANGYTNHEWITGRTADATIDGCYFEKQKGTTIFDTSGGSSTLGLRISNNYFEIMPATSITFQLKNSTFTGNRFILTGSNKVIFNSSATDNVFVGNFATGGVTNSGAGTYVSANKV